MSFTFSFSGDDIEEDTADLTDSDKIANRLEATKLQDSGPRTELLKPKRYTFAGLLESLPSQISYNLLKVTNTSDSTRLHDTKQDVGESEAIRIPRRALFDIRQQLMHEVDIPTSSDSERHETTDSDPTENLLAGLETGDLSTGIYEGGFKTWECAIDLASYISSLLPETLSPDVDSHDRQSPLHIIELGAGSAIPSLTLLHKFLSQNESKRKIRLTLCDYNEEVLRLCTATNTFLTISLCTDNKCNSATDSPDEAELDIDESSISNTLTTLNSQNIQLNFISGAWSPEFINLLNLDTTEQVLVLASETIYAPGSLPPFTQTVLDITSSSGKNSRALVAAKKVYFGVGGGIAEFMDELNRRDAKAEVIADVQGAGVGRVILEVARPY